MNNADLHRPFVSRRGRRVALTLGVLQLLVTTGVVVAMGSGFALFDRVTLMGMAFAVGALLWRFATVSVKPSQDSLVVRNLLTSRRLVWTQVVSVRMGGGNPWATLDLDDADTLAVMAIQRADGEWADSEAKRLATLVALHSKTPRNS